MYTHKYTRLYGANVIRGCRQRSHVCVCALLCRVGTPGVRFAVYNAAGYDQTSARRPGAVVRYAAYFRKDGPRARVTTGTAAAICAYEMTVEKETGCPEPGGDLGDSCAGDYHTTGVFPKKGRGKGYK